VAPELRAVLTDLASVHALVGDEGLGVVLESVRVAESDACKRSTTTGVVDNLLYDAPDVSIALRLCQLALCPRRRHFGVCVRRRT
jgi:hypothetical protein